MLIDTTLREGEQRYGVYFVPEDKERIVDGLIRLGVEEIELGVAGRDGCVARLFDFARARLAQAPESPEGTGRPALGVWCTCREADLDKAAALAPDRLNIGVPVSDRHIEKRLRTDRTAILRKVEAAGRKAAELGFGYVSLGLEDVSRADLAFALEVARTAERCGFRRVRLSDTVGVLSPLDTARLVDAFRLKVSVEIGLHLHNDFGLAAGNCLAGLEAGADYVDCALLGLGERAGIAPLEELAAFLALRRSGSRAGRRAGDGPPRYDLSVLPELCSLAARAAGTEAQPHKPIVGGRLFHCESGLHADGLHKDPELYEPFPPETFGQSRHIALGKKSGRAAVERRLTELSIPCPDPDGAVERVRRAAERKGAPLTDGEVREAAGP